MSAALSAQEDSSVIVEGNATVSSLETSDSASAKVQGSSSVGKLEREDSSSLTVTSCRTDDLANVKHSLIRMRPSQRSPTGPARLLFGRGAGNQAAAGVSEGDEIDVLSGDVALTNLPDGVMVTNSGGGTVSANGEDVAAGDSYTVETPLAIRITAQPRDAIVTEGETRRSPSPSRAARRIISGASRPTAAGRSPSSRGERRELHDLGDDRGERRIPVRLPRHRGSG